MTTNPPHFSQFFITLFFTKPYSPYFFLPVATMQLEIQHSKRASELFAKCGYKGIHWDPLGSIEINLDLFVSLGIH